MPSTTLDEILAHRPNVVVSSPGTGQTSLNAPLACGLLAMNAARVVLEVGRYKRGDQLILEMMKDETIQRIVDVVQILPNTDVLEVDNLRGAPLFSNCLSDAGHHYNMGSECPYTEIIRKMRQDKTLSAAVITQRGHIVVLFYFLADDGHSVYALFNSASESSSFTFNRDGKIVLASLRQDHSALDPVDCFCFTAREPPLVYNETQLMLDTQEYLLRHGAQIPESLLNPRTIVPPHRAPDAFGEDFRGLQAQLGKANLSVEGHQRARNELSAQLAACQADVLRFRKLLITPTSLQNDLARSEEQNRQQAALIQDLQLQLAVATPAEEEINSPAIAEQLEQADHARSHFEAHLHQQRATLEFQFAQEREHLRGLIGVMQENERVSFASRRAEAQQHLDNVQGLVQQMRMQVQEIVLLEERSAQMEEEIQQLRVELERSNARVMDPPAPPVVSPNVRAEEAVRELAQERAMHSEELNTLRERNVQLGEKIEDLKAELERSNARVVGEVPSRSPPVALQAEAARLHRRKEGLKATNAQLRQEIATQSRGPAENIRLQAEVDRLRARNRALQAASRPPAPPKGWEYEARRLQFYAEQLEAENELLITQLRPTDSGYASPAERPYSTLLPEDEWHVIPSNDYDGGCACGSCLKTANAPPVEPCGHRLCSECVKEHIVARINEEVGGDILCPRCRVNPSTLTDQFILNSGITEVQYAVYRARKGAEPPRGIASRLRGLKEMVNPCCR